MGALAITQLLKSQHLLAKYMYLYIWCMKNEVYLVSMEANITSKFNSNFSVWTELLAKS